MNRYEDINARLEKLENYIYNGIYQILQDNKKNVDQNRRVNDNLLKFKPSKHQKAYKLEKDFKKRCYTR